MKSPYFRERSALKKFADWHCDSARLFHKKLRNNREVNTILHLNLVSTHWQPFRNPKPLISNGAESRI